MKGAFVIFCAMVVIGIVLYLSDLFFYKKRKTEPVNPLPDKRTEDSVDDESEPTPEGEVCCGMHTVCEKTNLSPVSDEIIYYDDEELDSYKGRDSNEYTPEETEGFRDILLTMDPKEVAGWSRSLQLRGISLPSEIREELLMIVGDLRSNA